MNKYLTYIGGFLGFRGGSALAVTKGVQDGAPKTNFIEDVPSTSIDGALQISAFWRGIEILSKLIATMPLMVYENKKWNARFGA